jgi:hypothetical protein
MFIFKNFVVVMILMGAFTRLSNYILFKYFKEKSIYFSFFIVGLTICPLAAIFLGFDVAISEYLIALLLWCLFDLARKK